MYKYTSFVNIVANNTRQIMTLFEYFETAKYKNYLRNNEIFNERSSGIFFNSVTQRVKLELMGSGLVDGDNVITGFNKGGVASSPIASLIVPSTLLSSITSAYISYSTNGKVLFNDGEDIYLKNKVKEIIKIQSVGGSVLVKKVEYEGKPLLNLYSPLTYFVERDPFIQDVIKSYTIFNKTEETEDYKIYLTEKHNDTVIEYRYIKFHKESKDYTILDTKIEGLAQLEDENGIIYSLEALQEKIVTEVSNTCFNGNSDYTDDNVALLRELVVNNTINSQTFDKISNPLLSLPESALEYDNNGNAKVNLNDRVLIIRDGEGKPEQIKLESKIEQSQLHKSNIEENIFSSLAVNKTSLGLTNVSQLSGEALKRMMSATIARVNEKREAVSNAFKELLGIDIIFPEVVPPSFEELVKTVGDAVSSSIMSQEKGAKMVSGEDDFKKIKEEQKATDYQGFNE